MNLSTLYRPFELTSPWAGATRRAKATPASPTAMPGLTDLQRRLVLLHVAQATPMRPADSRPSWPGVAISCSLAFAALAVVTGVWQ
jgi:hypothetical protein